MVAVNTRLDLALFLTSKFMTSFWIYDITVVVAKLRTAVVLYATI